MRRLKRIIVGHDFGVGGELALGSAVAHMLLGSVAEKMVRAASCPVLTIRPEVFQFAPR